MIESSLQSVIWRLESVIKESELRLNDRKEELFYLNKQFKEVKENAKNLEQKR